jgi:glycine/D-amino acid oxidase-like deaminating enzyme
MTLSGRPISPWLDETPAAARPQLDRDLAVEVAVVGAGLIGLSTAIELQRRGVSVAVLEARSVAAGVSGNTTAKLSSLHGLTYDSLLAAQGRDAAGAYAAANQWGIDQVERTASELGIDCDLRRKPNFTYTEAPARVEQLGAEAEAARSLGLSATFTEETDLPFEVAGAVRLDDQAEIQPVAYLRGIADALDSEEPTVYERTRVVAVDGTVRTEAGPRVDARRVVLATQIPFLDRGLFFARAGVQRSYATSVRIHGELAALARLGAAAGRRRVPRARPWRPRREARSAAALRARPLRRGRVRAPLVGARLHARGRDAVHRAAVALLGPDLGGDRDAQVGPGDGDGRGPDPRR